MPDDHQRLRAAPIYSLSEEVQDEICALLAEGESLKAICVRPSMPTYGQVNRLLSKDAGLRDRFDRARLSGVEALAEDIIRIADTTADPNRAKVMIDARKWLASKLMPKKYGEQLHLTGEIRDDVDVRSRLAQLLGKARVIGAGGAGAEEGEQEPAGGVQPPRAGPAGSAAVPAVPEADGVPRRRL